VAAIHTCVSMARDKSLRLTGSGCFSDMSSLADSSLHQPFFAAAGKFSGSFNTAFTAHPVSNLGPLMQSSHDYCSTHY
jgi:hypothetical protein